MKVSAIQMNQTLIHHSLNKSLKNQKTFNGLKGATIGGIIGTSIGIGASIATFGLAIPAAPALMAMGAAVGSCTGSTIGHKFEEYVENDDDDEK